MTDFFLGLGKIFTWSFKIFPSIGPFMSTLLSIIGFVIFVYFTLKIFVLGQDDKKYKGDFK